MYTDKFLTFGMWHKIFLKICESDEVGHCWRDIEWWNVENSTVDKNRHYKLWDFILKKLFDEFCLVVHNLSKRSITTSFWLSVCGAKFFQRFPSQMKLDIFGVILSVEMSKILPLKKIDTTNFEILFWKNFSINFIWLFIIYRREV